MIFMNKIKTFLKTFGFDCLLGLLVILIALVLMLSLFFKKNDDNIYAYVYYHNEIVEIIDLSKASEEVTTKSFDFDGSIVIIEYKYNAIRVIDADCKEHTCVKTGWTSKTTKPIVCMDIGYEIRLQTKETNYDVVVG